MVSSQFRFNFLAALALLVAPIVGVAEEVAPAAPEGSGAAGPDVTVWSLPSVRTYSASNGIRGYAVATTSCNEGTAPLNWCDAASGCGAGTTAKDHPVIGQNMYRLHNGRMDQIGASWLKHGFLSLNQSESSCGDGSCATPPLGGRQLGVGCTDPYGSSLNGSRPLGRKSEVNAATGDFPMPPGGGGASSEQWNQRIAVKETDLNTTLHPGARYFVEGQYVAPDDALSGNGLNNASYREVTVNQSSFSVSVTGGTIRKKAAIEAWQTIDPEVELLNIDMRSEGVTERFHVARKVTQPSPGLWHYEYAVHNLNSDRSASSLRIDFFSNPVISATGFSDVDAHSNEPYDTTDWSAVVTTNSVEWAAAPFPSFPDDANAIRWGNTYNFWFDSSYPPTEIAGHSLGLFKAGSPNQEIFWTGTGVLFSDSMEND